MKVINYRIKIIIHIKILTVKKLLKIYLNLFLKKLFILKKDKLEIKIF